LNCAAQLNKDGERAKKQQEESSEDHSKVSFATHADQVQKSLEITGIEVTQALNGVAGTMLRPATSTWRQKVSVKQANTSQHRLGKLLESW